MTKMLNIRILLSLLHNGAQDAAALDQSALTAMVSDGFVEIIERPQSTLYPKRIARLKASAKNVRSVR